MQETVVMPPRSGDEARASHVVRMSSEVSARAVLPMLGLTALAGLVDAIGYTQLSGLYLSFMSGNSTRLGVLIGHGELPGIGACLAVIGCFVAGACVGTLLADGMGRQRAAGVLAAEAALMGSAAILTCYRIGLPALLPAVMAMGMQNVLHGEFRGVDAGKTFVTGVLFSLGQSLANVVRGRVGVAALAVPAALWAAFVAGVVAGAAGLSLYPLPLTLSATALVLAAAALLSCASVRSSA